MVDSVVRSGCFKPTRGSAESHHHEVGANFKPTRGSAERWSIIGQIKPTTSFKPTRGSAESFRIAFERIEHQELQTHEGFG